MAERGSFNIFFLLNMPLEGLYPCLHDDSARFRKCNVPFPRARRVVFRQNFWSRDTHDVRGFETTLSMHSAPTDRKPGIVTWALVG